MPCAPASTKIERRSFIGCSRLNSRWIVHSAFCLDIWLLCDTFAFLRPVKAAASRDVMLTVAHVCFIVCGMCFCVWRSQKLHALWPLHQELHSAPVPQQTMRQAEEGVLSQPT